jgi:glycosyltransferase involved in cell wall biosynthesis
MTQTPLVSTIIPVYNGERYLAEAIESVLGQSAADMEVIVVDDGSSDGSAAVARSFGEAVRYCHQPHGGIGAALNHGLALAQGAYIASLDADDLWEKRKLERQLAVAEADAGPVLIFGHVRQFISPDLDEDAARKLRCPPDLMPGYIPGTVLARRETFDYVGAFATQWRAGEFLDWYLRAKDMGVRIVMLPDLVLYRRLHRTNHGIVDPEAKTDLTKVLRLALARRRAADGEGS